MSNTDPVKIPGLNPGVHEGYVVHVSYKTIPCTHIVKLGKRLCHRGKTKNLREKNKIHCQKKFCLRAFISVVVAFIIYL